MKKYEKVAIIDIDGEERDEPDFPVAILRKYPTLEDDESIFEGFVIDPVFNDKVSRNLYGRIMTLVEATTEPSRLKSVKDIFSKELKSWERDLQDSASNIAIKSPRITNNIYK